MGAKKYSRKGAAEMNETILVMLFVFILISLSMIIYYKASSGNIKERGFELSEQSASVLLNSITGMPELKCGNEDCLDMIKIIAFKDVIKNNEAYYKKVFGNKKIFIEKIYPESIEKECSLIEFNSDVFPANCNKITIFENGIANYASRAIVSSSVSLYDSEHSAHSVGKLTIEVYR